MTEPAHDQTMIAAAPAAHARRLVGVQFRRAAAVIYDFDAGALELAHDTRVVVETDRGEALGWTVGTPEARDPHLSDAPVRRVLRVATAQDGQRDQQNHEREKEALRYAAKRAHQLGLPMKFVAVEWGHTGDKAAFYFSSDTRVDFRVLVRELAQRFRLRVEMRQVGPRDEAKIIGAMGPCGRETCCSSWMRAFTPVSIKMAKDQGLALNPQKVTGVCGRLLCCLAYEQETYRALRKGLPKWGRTVVTPRGTGRVVDVLTLRRKVRVSIDGEWIDFAAEEVQPVGATGPDEPDTDDGDELPGEEWRGRRPDRRFDRASDRPADPGDRRRPDRRGDAPAPTGAPPAPEGARPRPERPRFEQQRPEQVRSERQRPSANEPQRPMEGPASTETRPDAAAARTTPQGPSHDRPPRHDRRPPRPGSRSAESGAGATPPAAPPDAPTPVGDAAEADGHDGGQRRHRRHRRRGGPGGGESGGGSGNTPGGDNN